MYIELALFQQGIAITNGQKGNLFSSAQASAHAGFIEQIKEIRLFPTV